MASTTDSGSEWSWSSWISSAKEKSMAALSATTRDLAEFVNVVQEDTTKAASDAANKVKQIINKEEESVEDSTAKDQSPTVNANQEEASHPTYDRAVAHLEVLRSDPNTYCTVPEGKGGDFLDWSRDFDLSTQQDEISRLLVVSVNVRKLHSALVPAKVSYESFWFNYFYRVHLLNEQEAHRAQIMSRVHSQGQLICWDDEELDCVETDRRGEGGIGKQGSEDGLALTDSSESFVCINDEDATKDMTRDDGLVINKGIGEGLVINDQKDKDVGCHDELDDDWENWNDN